VLAEQRALRSAKNLYALNIEKRGLEVLRAIVCNAIDREPHRRFQRLDLGIGAETPDIGPHTARGRRDTAAPDIEADVGKVVGEIDKIGDVFLVYEYPVDGRYRRGLIEEPFLAALRRNEHFFDFLAECRPG